jgi:hypothetical protein
MNLNEICSSERQSAAQQKALSEVSLLTKNYVCYDALPPGFVSKGFASDFLNLAVFPQLFLWIAFTVLVGTLFGVMATAIFQRRKPATQAA